MVGLGGYHLVRPELPEAESIRIVRAAIDNGLDFLDNSVLGKPLVRPVRLEEV
jgi:aryl-alcohol dehydrogenase-like predicted oxidoreductase